MTGGTEVSIVTIRMQIICEQAETSLRSVSA